MQTALSKFATRRVEKACGVGTTAVRRLATTGDFSRNFSQGPPPHPPNLPSTSITSRQAGLLLRILRHLHTLAPTNTLVVLPTDDKAAGGAGNFSFVCPNYAATTVRYCTRYEEVQVCR